MQIWHSLLDCMLNIDPLNKFEDNFTFSSQILHNSQQSMVTEQVRIEYPDRKDGAQSENSTQLLLTIVWAAVLSHTAPEHRLTFGQVALWIKFAEENQWKSTFRKPGVFPFSGFDGVRQHDVSLATCNGSHFNKFMLHPYGYVWDNVIEALHNNCWETEYLKAQILSFQRRYLK